MAYVPITRYLRDFTEDATSATTRRLLRSLRPDSELTWRSVLNDETDRRPVVLLAPSGSGKSTELEHQALQRREASKAAVFASAGSIVDGIADGLVGNEAHEYRAWRERTDLLIFFIDALDELYLRSRQLSDLFRRLQREIELSARPLRFVLSARNGSWTDSFTRELMELLGDTDQCAPRLMTFEPIDETALRQLAAANGVKDVDAFCKAFEDEEIDDLLHLRPSDVGMLAVEWNATRTLGAWSRTLSNFVTHSFSESRPELRRDKLLTPEQGRRGLERMAAAMTLMNARHVSSYWVGTQIGAVSARRLYDDWTLGQIGELFENPLVVPKGSNGEAVQLPQGPVFHFLAAQWLAARVRGGWSTADLEAAFLVRVFDEEALHLPNSLRDLAGWASSEIRTLRGLLLTTHPDVVLYGGDPESLTDAEITEGLRLVSEALAHQGHDPYWPSAGTLRKLARPSIEETVSSLLVAHADADSVQHNLLRLAEIGRYRSCVSHARQIATSPGRGSAVRAAAIAVIAAAGDESAQRALLELLNDTDDGVRLALLRSVVPTFLHGGDLVRFVSGANGPGFGRSLSGVAAQLATNDLDAILHDIRSRLFSDTISAETEHAFEVAVPVAIARLNRPESAPRLLLEVLTAVERLQHDHHSFYLSLENRNAIDKVVSRDVEIRRGLWLCRLEAAASDRYVTYRPPAFGDATEDDIEWLVEEGQSAPLALEVVDRLSARPINSAGLNDKAKTYLRGRERKRTEFEEKQKTQEEQARRKEEDERRKNNQKIDERRSSIESGEDLGALVWAWDSLRDVGSDDSKLDPVRLRSHVGPAQVELLLRGMRASWRRQPVPDLAPGSSISVPAAVGLAGLALDIRAGLDIATLSVSEAERAARYAMHGLNHLPFWFGDLFRAQPEVVGQVLRDAIASQWRWTEEGHGILRLARTSTSDVALAIREVVVQLLKASPPGHSAANGYAVGILLASGRDREVVAGLAKREIARHQAAPKRLPEWFRLWTHFEPEESGEWFLEALGTDANRGGAILLDTVALLENDLDERFGQAAPTWLMAPASLARWIRLLFAAFPPEEDIEHTGRSMHPVGSRDYAERFRERCVGRLASATSVEAHVILRGLRDDRALSPYQSLFNSALQKQVANAVEAGRSTWTEEDIARTEHGDERPARTLVDLYSMVRRHLADVGRLVMNDEFSYRRLFRSDTVEREIQLWVASCLRERARHLYGIVRENVVDLDKEVDISAQVAGVGTIPIEIKPLGSYSIARLVETIDEQLIQRYMRPPDRRCGVLLLVRRDRKTWQLNGRQVGIADVVGHLRQHAQKVAASTDKAVAVELIDLLEGEKQDRPRPSRTRNGQPPKLGGPAISAKPIKSSQAPIGTRSRSSRPKPIRRRGRQGRGRTSIRRRPEGV